MPDPVIRSVYLGGPEVFLANWMQVIEKKAAICATYGFKATLPNTEHVAQRASGQSPPETSRLIYEANVGMMQASDFGLFDLTPFRGASADAGTCYELGFMSGLGKPVFGYTNVSGDYIDRIAPRQQQAMPDGASRWIDQDGYTIENYGNADNLMIDSAVALRGALMVRGDPALPQRMLAFPAYEAALKDAQAYFQGAGDPAK